MTLSTRAHDIAVRTANSAKSYNREKDRGAKWEKDARIRFTAAGVTIHLNDDKSV